MYCTCVTAFWPAEGAGEAVGRMCGCSSGRGAGPLLCVGVTVAGDAGF